MTVCKRAPSLVPAVQWLLRRVSGGPGTVRGPLPVSPHPRARGPGAAVTHRLLHEQTRVCKWR